MIYTQGKCSDMLKPCVNDLILFKCPHSKLCVNVVWFQVLLGLLTGTEKQFVSRGNSAASQEPYNILPLASTQIR